MYKIYFITLLQKKKFTRHLTTLTLVKNAAALKCFKLAQALPVISPLRSSCPNSIK